MEHTQVGIEETMELIEALSVALDSFEKIMADGEVTLTDIRFVPKLFAALKPGLEGLQKIPFEAADYNDAEMEQVSTAVVALLLKAAQKFA